MRILVVGGGIAGLTAGIVLGRSGHEVTVAERSPDFDTIGAGIALGAGAEAILDSLGVDELRRTRHRRVRAVQKRSRRIGQIAQLRGRTLGRIRSLTSTATPDVLVRRQHAALMAPGHALAAQLDATS